MNLSGPCPLLGFPSAMAMVVPSQSWLARDALGWTVTDLARAAGVSVGAVQRFESGAVPRPETLEAIQRALEMAGIIFIDASEGGPGVRLRKAEYTVKLVHSQGFWEWEIHRDGKPLPVRLREDGYKTKRAAKSAANVAFRDFLSKPAQADNKPD
jgi:transcriptional regulator with XRE-family HTH domain